MISREIIRIEGIIYIIVRGGSVKNFPMEGKWKKIYSLVTVNLVK